MYVDMVCGLDGYSLLEAQEREEAGVCWWALSGGFQAGATQYPAALFAVCSCTALSPDLLPTASGPQDDCGPCRATWRDEISMGP